MRAYCPATSLDRYRKITRPFEEDGLVRTSGWTTSHARRGPILVNGKLLGGTNLAIVLLPLV
jgi:hypothetical protein